MSTIEKPSEIIEKPNEMEFLVNNCLRDTFDSAKIEEQCHKLKMPKGPIISIVIDDLGEGNPSRTDEALKIPGITAAFIPAAGNPRLQEQVRTAHETGHEIIMHTPMGTGKSDVDVGENRLMTGQSTSQIESNLWWNKKQFGNTMQYFAGSNNHQGSKFTTSSVGMYDTINYLDKTTDMKYVLDSKTSPDSRVCEAAAKLNVPCVERDVFLDHDNNIGDIRERLEEAFQHAVEQGSAIAIGHHYSNTTLEVLRNDLSDLSEKYKVTIVPVSDVVERRLGVDLGVMP